MEDAAHTLLLPFDTDDPAFTRGFEAGRIWVEASQSEEELVVVGHAANAEMFMRMGEALGRTVVGEELDNGWIEVTLGAPGSAPELSPEPGHQ